MDIIQIWIIEVQGAGRGLSDKIVPKQPSGG
jgi:hypothetical protein